MQKKYIDCAFILLFIAALSLQIAVVLLSPLTLSPDETHYWQWSKNLDWSYYSKGPFLAWAIAISTSIFGDSIFAVRFPNILTYSIFSLIFYLFIRKEFSALSALISWIALRSILIFSQMGFLMTTDAPAALFWLLALVSAYTAIFKNKENYWILFGLFLGIGMWSKYTLAFLYPSIAIFLLISKRLNILFSKKFFVGAFTFILSLFPILYWNMQHGWVNFAHNSGHILKQSGLNFKISYFFELLAGQLGLVGPIIFICLIYTFYKIISNKELRTNQAGFLRSLVLFF